jgi:hypothetical protein
MLQGGRKTPNFVASFLGVLSGGCRMAEKIPVEPDQGNACAGKVIQSNLAIYYPFAVFPA